MRLRFGEVAHHDAIVESGERGTIVAIALGQSANHTMTPSDPFSSDDAMSPKPVKVRLRKLCAEVPCSRTSTSKPSNCAASIRTRMSRSPWVTSSLPRNSKRACRAVPLEAWLNSSDGVGSGAARYTVSMSTQL